MSVNAAATGAPVEHPGPSPHELVRIWRPRLQRGGWWLMYSPRRGLFTAFYRGAAPQPIVVEAEFIEELLPKLGQQVHALWGSPAQLAASPRMLPSPLPSASRGR